MIILPAEDKNYEHKDLNDEIVCHDLQQLGIIPTKLSDISLPSLNPDILSGKHFGSMLDLIYMIIYVMKQQMMSSQQSMVAIW